MSDGRLPARLEVTALIRATESAGGFATVLARGEPDSGSILIVTCERDGGRRLWERMPRLDGPRRFEVSRNADGDPRELDLYLDRRRERDPDCWILELDIADAERFIAEFTP